MSKKITDIKQLSNGDRVRVWGNRGKAHEGVIFTSPVEGEMKIDVIDSYLTHCIAMVGGKLYWDNIELIEREVPESLEDLKVGDFVASGELTRRVLWIQGDKFLLSSNRDYSKAEYLWSMNQLLKYIYKPCQDPRLKKKELTMEELKEIVGEEFKIIEG